MTDPPLVYAGLNLELSHWENFGFDSTQLKVGCGPCTIRPDVPFLSMMKMQESQRDLSDEIHSLHSLPV